MIRGLTLLFVAFSLAASAAPADDLFLTQVEPVLKNQCQGCHGVGQVLGKLDLRNREAMLKGGVRGPAVVPGKAEESLLYKAVLGADGLMMPPGGPEKSLPEPAIAAIKQWIDAGAPWPQAEKTEAKWNYKEKDLWAFRPVQNVKIPGNGAANPVDAFVHAKLAERGIEAAPEADRRTLIRRVTIDLTGLPPTPQEIDEFVKDQRPEAWERLVERLLASPRYGERWARHWLDVVRYADTSGYSNDFERPNAWRYRDYVIRSLNQDKPYNHFIEEQVAGDELYPNSPEAIIATGFLRAGPWEHTGMSVEAVTRQMFLDDVTHAVGTAFLGVTLGCARCHDHKFDPIPTKDYYRMQAIFATTEFARPEVPFLANENTRDIDSGRSYIRQVIDRTDAKMKGFDQFVTTETMKKHGVSRPEDLPEGVLEAALKSRDGLTPDQFEELKLYQKHLQLYRESVDRYEPKAFAVSSGPLDGATDGGPNLKYSPRKEYEPSEVHILIGGNIQAPGEKVEPGVLSVIAKESGLPTPEIPDTVAGRRAALARWITDPRNPLTRRVMVNRIWQGHFGRAIAANTNNFGKMGAKPTHPELLDWLAEYLLEQNWSLKAVHRVILLSDTYRRASSHPEIEKVREKDPENELLAYITPRRVEAEVLRDSLLAVSGELSTEGGGPGVFPQINEDVARQPRHAMGSLQPAYYPSPEKRLRNRRAIYAFQQRSLIDPMVEVFNSPSLDLSCERREASTVPTQAFTLFNAQLVYDAALAFAARIEKEAPGSVEAKIDRAFRLAYGRNSSPEEKALARQHFEKQLLFHQANQPPAKPEAKPLVHTIMSELTGEQFRFEQQPDPVTYEANLHPSEVSAETRALSDLALVLLNSNEFVYVY